MARLSVTGGVLKEALTLLTPQQRADLADRLSALFAGVSDLWPVETRIDFEHALVDEYERILFRIGQMNQVGKGRETGIQKSYFLCIKCNIPVIAIDTNTLCPGGGTANRTLRGGCRRTTRPDGPVR